MRARTVGLALIATLVGITVAPSLAINPVPIGIGLGHRF